MLDSGAATTNKLNAPGHGTSICQNGNKSTARGTNLLNILKLILDFGAVTTMGFIAPVHHASICHNCSKNTECATELLHILPLFLHSGAARCGPPHVTTVLSAKMAAKALWLNLLNISQLILPSGAVTAMVWQAPRNNSVSSNTPQSKRTPRCSYLWPLSNSSKAVTGQATSFCWIRKAPAHRGQQASGRVAAKTSAQLISSQQRCQTARQREFHSVHSAGRPQGRLGNQPSEDCHARYYRGQPVSLLVSWSFSKKIVDFTGNNGSIWDS